MMKILNVLNSIISESRSKFHRLFTTSEGIKFIASKHQTEDRKGYLDYDEIKDIILKAVDSQTKTHTRVGVPNRMLSKLIRNKHLKILDELNKNPKDEKIRFIYKRKDNEDDEIFDFIEFVIARNEDGTFVIVSSTFSDNGDYLKKYGRDAIQARKIMLEKYFHIKTISL